MLQAAADTHQGGSHGGIGVLHRQHVDAVHPWRVVYGPLQATACYLLQMGWNGARLWNWTKGDVAGGAFLQFGIKCSPWELENSGRQNFKSRRKLVSVARLNVLCNRQALTGLAAEGHSKMPLSCRRRHCWHGCKAAYGARTTVKSPVCHEPT